MKALRILILAGLVGVGVWWLIKRGPQPATNKPDETTNVVPATPFAPSPSNSRPPLVATNSAVQNVAAGPAGNGLTLALPASQPARNLTNYMLGSPGALPATMSAQAVLENARRAIVNYESTFDGNPVGTNPEITAALNGENPKQIKFLNPDDGMRVNGLGELVDAWGTPFFFHQLSGKEMEIRSAGPDHRMWTGDDLLIKQ